MADRIMKKQNNYKNIDVEFQLLKLLNDPLSVKVRSSRLLVSARKVQLLEPLADYQKQPTI